MSKQPKKSTKRNWLRRGLSGILSLALILALLPGMVLPAQAAHWAMPYAEKLMEWGVMRGDNGNLALDRAITRAEFVAMMNRAYGYKRLGEMPFPDVKTRDWYYQDINIAYNMGYFKGASGYALPKANLTREQAAVLLTRNMMLRENVGEGLQFSDSRSLSEWSRGLVGAAADMGIIGGYSDGSFKPQQNITRGEVASMLVKAIGTMVKTPGEHALGDVYGNVTVNSAGVKLKNGTIAGNLYLTGGIDLGDVLLENVNVLGEIIVSGGGESSSSQSSITLRNVSADAMTVDSISNQFVTLRAEGITDVGTTTVRTNAYVDDSSLPGFGLRLIIQDGGSLLQLAGNVKEVRNQTPNASLQVVQGSADKITIDEKATNSTVLVDGDARVDDLRLDVGTRVEGDGDIKNLNVWAAGSTVEKLPDDVSIRPGLTADINGSEMNSSQAAESSADPRLQAGYPKVKNIAPNSADLVFSTNKAGTVYWAVSAVSDGSVSEEDLIEPPSYGGKIFKSGSAKMTASNTEVKAAISGLTQAGSYYVSTVFVDNRGVHSPVKVTAFTTPDGTVPAFSDGPRMSRITTEVAQVTGMPNKSCQLYYALLPRGATAPTAAELKANAVRGNLGYGIRDVVKNTNVNINVNSRQLDQETDYVVYLWLTDYDGSKSSRVYSVPFKTPDERAPVIISTRPGGANETAVEMNFIVDEACTLFWTIVPEGRDSEIAFEGLENEDNYKSDGLANPEDPALQRKIEAGAGKFTTNGKKAVSAANANKEVLIGLNETRTLDSSKTGTSTYVMYMVAKDASGNYSKIEKVTVKTRDNTPPRFVRQEFTAMDSGSKEPKADTDIKLVFSENIKGGSGADKVFLKLYEEVLDAAKQSMATGGGESEVRKEADARNKLAAALAAHIRLYRGETGDRAEDLAAFCTSCEARDDGNGNFYIASKYTKNPQAPNSNAGDWIINYCFAKVEMADGSLIVTFPTVENSNGTVNMNASALNLASGATYHFVLSGIRDNAEDPNRMDPDPTEVPYFTTEFAKVNLSAGEELYLDEENHDGRIDFHFIADPQGASGVDESQYWDMMIWANTTMGFTLYSRPKGGTDGQWNEEGSAEIRVPSTAEYVYTSVVKNIYGKNTFDEDEQVCEMTSKEYAIHIDWLEDEANTDASKWNKTVRMRVSMVCGTKNHLIILPSAGTSLDGETVISIPKPFEMSYPFKIKDAPDIQSVSITSKYDTSVDISVDLGDTAGQVYYMYFPLNTLRDGSNNTVGGPNITLTEAMLQNQVKSYAADYTVKVNTADASGILPVEVPVMSLDSALSETPKPSTTKKEVAQPSVNAVTSTARIPGVIKGHTNKVEPGSPANFSLTNLSSNTVYYICLVTQGDSDDPNAYSKSAVVYRFTTQRAARPLFNLSGSGSVVNVESDRKATMNYFLASYGYENEAFRRAFSSSGTYSYADSSLDSNTYTYEGKGQPMNVLTAMATRCYDNLNNYVGSVFDIFATDSAKNIFAGLIANQSTQPGQIIETGKNRPVAATPEGVAIPTSNIYNYTRNNDVKPGTEYIFVAVAQGDQGSGYSFCAQYPVTKTDLTPPMVTGAYVDGGTWNADRTMLSNATVVLDFSEELYAVSRTSGNQTAYQICYCVNGATGHVAATGSTGGNPIGTNDPDVKNRYWGVGYLANATLNGKLQIIGEGDHANGKASAPIRTIRLSLSSLDYRDTATISFSNAYICDSVGNGTERQSVLTVTVKMVNQGTAAAPNWQPVVTLGSPAQWDAR